MNKKELTALVDQASKGYMHIRRRHGRGHEVYPQVVLREGFER